MTERDETIWTGFSGPNLAYLQELYERYRRDPRAVDPTVRGVFERWGSPPPPAAPPAPSPAPAAAAAPAAPPVAAAVALARAIRAFGHLTARLDPLGISPPGDAALRAETYGVRAADLAAVPATVVGGPASETAANALEALQALRQIYQGTTGYEFEHVPDEEERDWLYQAVEEGRFRPPKDPVDERRLLDRLTEVGAFERFLHRAFPGQIRFSLEGLGMMVPMLDELVALAARGGVRTLVLAMAHRGRLNVLAHVLGKPYERIIAEFLGHVVLPGVSPSGSSDPGWTGDVKYHLGGFRAYPSGGQEGTMRVVMPPNPSHLEFVDPVALGMARASGERRHVAGPPRRDEGSTLAVLVHGEAAFAGQGVVAETLNLARLPGYTVGGTVHLIANNQLGFTTPPSLGRSTRYASDLAKGFGVPIVHVNADDPEACLAAVRLAHAYRERFRKDVVIDLIGYRRWGHNEGDEPSFTQPLMYRVIEQHPTVRELWARELVRRGLVTEEEVERSLQEAIDRLFAIRRSFPQHGPPEDGPGGEPAGLEAGGPAEGVGSPGPAVTTETAVPLGTLVQLNEELLALPEGFKLHPRLERFFARRRAAFEENPEMTRRTVDWAHAEELALASILADGTPVRLTGQDTVRGTFSQRHLVLYDVETGTPYSRLQALPAARASCEVWDSPLSESSTLGFEYGYSVQAPDALVLWEAQYGDFINVAQAMVDEFVVSGRAKWGQRSALVLLLPHGYAGQGPDHSSGRMERFLQMAAEDNLRIANCTTAAQYFHLLRRQARLLELDPRPLVVFTPKSLLRHPLAASAPRDLAEGRFHPLLEDVEASRTPERVRRLVLCTGKVYVDLAATGRLAEVERPVAVARVEELYPFPAEAIARLIESYPRLEEVVWLQEEPRNMGAWAYVAPRLRDLVRGRLPLRYIGRTRRASPAEGTYEWHAREQARLVDAAFQLGAVEA